MPRLPRHGAGDNRFGQPFEVERPDGSESGSVARTDQGPDEVGGEDLTTGGGGTEPGGLDDRGAVDVVVLEGHVAEGNPDPNRQRRAETAPAVVPVD